MKTFYKILILILISLSLFIMKDDLKAQTDKLITYIRQNKASEEVTNDITNKIEEPIIKEETPGPLAVDDTTSTPKTGTENSNITKNSSTSTNTQTEVPTNQNTTTSKNILTLNATSIIEITNEYRGDEDLSSLKENEKLKISAQKKVDDMFKNQYFEHTSPDGIGASDLANQVGYSYILIGENLAVGSFKSNRTLVDAWMNSPGHRANILNKSYTEIGVAVGRGKYQGRDVWMAVQHFGLPKSVCPAIDESLKGMITINQNRMEDMEEELSERKEMIDNGAIYEGSSYYEQINEYNDLLEDYYNLIEDTKDKIDEYNREVREFNSCLSSKT